MKKATIFALAIVITASSIVFAGDTVFRNLSWGDYIKALGNCVLVNQETYPGIQIYRKTDESLNLGSFKASWIEYYFFDDKLLKIVVQAPSGNSSEKHDALKRMLTAKYGEPHKANFFSDTAEWLYNDTRAELIWNLFDGVYFSLNSISINKQYEAWLEKFKNNQAKSNAEAW